jgi:hypothetical protein
MNEKKAFSVIMEIPEIEEFERLTKEQTELVRKISQNNLTMQALISEINFKLNGASVHK